MSETTTATTDVQALRERERLLDEALGALNGACLALYPLFRKPDGAIDIDAPAFQAKLAMGACWVELYDERKQVLAAIREAEREEAAA